LSNGVLLLQDNAPVHKLHVAMAAAYECGFKLLRHPPYSPDLAPSDYFLFSNLKSKLQGRQFLHNLEVITAVETYFKDKSLEFFFRGLEKLEDRYNRCVLSKSEYFKEKKVH